VTEDVRVTRSVTIPASELRFRFSPSGGPGGQHANRSSTRAELRWHVAGSSALGPRQKTRVLRALAGRIGADGELRVVADERRSQAQNRAAAVERLRGLVASALAVPKRRRPTAPPRAAKERRLEQKRRRSERKRLRRAPTP
jgi:ribosome-associated protein